MRIPTIRVLFRKVSRSVLGGRRAEIRDLRSPTGVGIEFPQGTSMDDASLIGASIMNLAARLTGQPALGGFADGLMNHWAAKQGALAGKVYATHDPCTGCGHGRLLHKHRAYRDVELRSRDESLSETQCRHGQHINDPCGCERWSGVETKVPKFL